MAKTKTLCIVCGGTHDGTPSGLLKHEATGKHQAVATPNPRKAELEAAIADRQAAIAKRQPDVEWRRKNRPDLLDNYVAKKITPHVEAIALWTRELESL